MPATRSVRASTRRRALAEAPVSKQQTYDVLDKQLSSTATLKDRFAVTKHNNACVVVTKKSVKTKAASSFVATKRVLHRSTAAPQIIGRESEQMTIRKFLQDTVEKGRGGSMYISGNPGTGKTACLQALIKQSAVDFASVLVNCVPLTRPGQVYAAVLNALNVKFKSADSALADLEKHVFCKGHAFLVILDEVDSLLGNRQEVLYRLFELAAHPSSRLALVGIANALDLTDRFLPRLQARNCEPLLLNFNPYQVNDIVVILQSRLDSVASSMATEPLIQKAALELCARKVAATSGDLRKALDVCRQAMEAAEAEHKRKSMTRVGDKENGVASVTAASPKVTIMHIAKVLTNLNGSSTTQKLNSLNFQQKLVLCAYVFLTSAAASTDTPSKKSAASNGITLSDLFAEYCAVCNQLRMLAPVTRSEFFDLVAMMETQGVVSVQSLKAGRRGRRSTISVSDAADDKMVRLVVDEVDVRRALSTTAALAPLL